MLRNRDKSGAQVKGDDIIITSRANDFEVPVRRVLKTSLSVFLHISVGMQGIAGTRGSAKLDKGTVCCFSIEDKDGTSPFESYKWI
jgi:hypothetical protein